MNKLKKVLFVLAILILVGFISFAAFKIIKSKDDNPIVPGIYLIEGMAQTACFCKIPGISNKRSEILMIKNVKFRTPVKTNTIVKYEVVVKSVTSVIEFACKAYDENKTFATMEFIVMITKE